MFARPEEGLVYFLLYKSSHVVSAYKQAKDIVVRMNCCIRYICVSGGGPCPPPRPRPPPCPPPCPPPPRPRPPRKYPAQSHHYSSKIVKFKVCGCVVKPLGLRSRDLGFDSCGAGQV